MNKRRRYKAKHRRRWALIVRWQTDATKRPDRWNVGTGTQISAAIARGMGLPKQAFKDELQRRAERWAR